MVLLYKDESYIIRGICFEIYKELGWGHKESVYQNALFNAAKEKGFSCEKEKRLLVYYQGKKVGVYTPDLVINDKILIELKAKSILLKDDLNQFWHYLKSTNYKLGFLINFGKAGGVEIIRQVYDKARQKNSA